MLPIYIYIYIKLLRLSVCVVDSGKTCGPIFMKRFVHRGHTQT